MDKKAIHELLNFLGAARPPFATMSWDLVQLKYAGVYFGMNGDDALLRQHFKRRIETGLPGRYVDLGAYHPAYISNTYLFYLMGWHGLGIDASSDSAGQWSQVRPRDMFENVAVGESEGTVYWWANASNSGMSKVTETNTPPGDDYGSTSVATPMKRLDTLFARHFPDGGIQFMSIDIEGAELGALKSNDWERWRPEAILMEASRFDLAEPRGNPAVAYLLTTSTGCPAKWVRTCSSPIAVSVRRSPYSTATGSYFGAVTRSQLR